MKAALVLCLGLLAAAPVRAAPEDVVVVPGGLADPDSRETYFVEGRGPVVRDFARADIYGGAAFPLRRHGDPGAAPFVAAEQRTQDAAIVEFMRLVADLKAGDLAEVAGVRELMGMLHALHRANAENPLPPRRPESPVGLLRNLATRHSSGTALVLAVNYGLNLAGFRTRLVRLGDDLETAATASPDLLEYHSPATGQWVLLSPVHDYMAVQDGTPRSIFQVYRSPALLAELNRHHDGRFGKGNVIGLTLPEPTYATPVEIYWSPTPGLVRAVRARRQQAAAR